MTRDDAKALLRDILGPGVELIDVGEWVSCPCILAPWTHERGRDRRPSAGIHVDDSGTSVYNCFSCHTKGPVFSVLRKLSRLSGENYDEIAEEIETGEMYGGDLPEWGAEIESVEDMPALDEETYFDIYDSAVGHPYLKKRGVSKKATRLANLRYDPGDGDTPRILFPVYSMDGVLRGFSGRATESSARLKVKDYLGLQKRNLLLGSHLIGPQHKYLLMVEGLVDYARLLTHGLPTVAFMSSTVTPAQIEIIFNIGLPIYFFHDNDKAGRDARDKATERICNQLPVMWVKYPKENTVETSRGDLRPPSDPAELTKEQIMTMIDKAKLA